MTAGILSIPLENTQEGWGSILCKWSYNVQEISAFTHGRNGYNEHTSFMPRLGNLGPLPPESRITGQQRETQASKPQSPIDDWSRDTVYE